MSRAAEVIEALLSTIMARHRVSKTRVDAPGHARFVYVASVVDDFIHRIDAEGGHVVDDVVVSTKPHRIVATPDGKNLLVAAELSGEIDIIDQTDFTVTAKIAFSRPDTEAVPVTITDFVLTRDGRTAYVALGGAFHVAAVDVQTRRIKDYVPIGEGSAHIGMTRNITSHEVTASTRVGRCPSAFVIGN
jgi:DNA-binding beta-propeller fold protein YncE